MKDVSYLANKPIAILGGGAAGRTHAADCKLGGAEVRLYEHPEFADSLGCIAHDRKITIAGEQMNVNGFQRKGTAELDMVTTDIKEAVSGAGNIVIAQPAVGFDLLFKRLIPVLEDGQVVHFMTGNFGSLVLRKQMKEMGCDKDIVVGEWTSQPYGTRIKTQSGVTMPIVEAVYRAVTLKASAMPASDTDTFIAASQYIPSLDAVVTRESGDTVLDVCFSNVNPVLHCPGTILGASVMENFSYLTGKDKYNFSIYSHAYSPSVAEVQYGFYLEQKKIGKKIGFGISEYKKEEFWSRMSVLGSELLGPDVKQVPFDEFCPIFESTGPFDIKSRYITEDIPVGCCIQAALGKKFGVETPIIDSMIVLASVMTGIDFKNNCWTLEKIGLDNMTKEEIMNYVR
ncbi:MAG: NAD/NADP octopine/nopaline dehydrogenase family protein [Eubacteriaceae bacterium]|jgi:opine dehydrogenase|nr:NAD/NADP octopine/nopaline dehydrogenase family protein [Eubacteriaceae bacterium]